MKKLAILVFAICCLSCKSSYSQWKVNPEAKKLNDTAISCTAKGTISPEKAIDLLNQATKIDSDYYLAYWNKIRFQLPLKQFDNAIATGNEMIRLRPDNISVIYKVGILFDRFGDTITARKYYLNFIKSVNNVLGTMSVNNKHFKWRQKDKATALVLLNQRTEGYKILRELNNNEPEGNFKQELKSLLNMNKHDLIYGQTTTIITRLQ